MVEKYQCYLCQKKFNSRQSKSQHLQICILHNKNKLEEKKVIEDAKVINNIGTQNNNNITNNTSNNINIISFDPYNKTARLLFRTNHITTEEFNRILQNSMEGDIDSIQKNIFTNYSKRLLDNEENRCIKKSNMRSQLSEVHVGNNKWEFNYDAHIYPKFLKEIAECLNELLMFKSKDIKLPNRLFTALDNFVNYMADYGYCSEDKDEATKIIKSYKEMLQAIKCQVFDYTKEV